MGAFLSICLGMGLSIACGFRTFLPVFIVSLCAKFNFITLNDGFTWLGNDYVLIACSIAMILEILAYYIPVLDNFLDYFSLPVAICAGILLSIACIKIEEPLFLWGLSMINGTLLVCLVKAMVSVLRSLSTTIFSTITNNILSSLENVISLVLSFLSIFLSFIIVFVFIGIIYLFIKFFKEIKMKLTEKKKKRIQ